MQARVHIHGHPVHPMMIALPLGLLPASIVTDVVRVATGNDFWGLFSFWLIVGGVVSGLAAGIVGFLDWLHFPAGTKARRIGAAHALANVAMLVLFVVSAATRVGDPGNPSALSISLSVGALLLGVLGGWLGGELVFRLGAGVQKNATTREYSP